MSDDADQLVARAIDRVLDQVPGTLDTSVPEASSKLQPWAETAAPASAKAKRPLEELLAELEVSVAENPGAVASLPSKRHPALAFFDRFSRPAREGGGEGTSRRRRRRRGGGSGAAQEPAASSAATKSQSSEPRSGRRRRRRGRGGSGGGETPRAAAPAPPQQPSTPRPAGSGRRRRGRRGRGGGGGGGQRPAAS